MICDPTFVLCDTSQPGNIGSCCRVLKNFGFLPEQLVLVSPTCVPTHDLAYAMAAQAEDWVSKIRIARSMSECLEGFTRVVGTSSIASGWRLGSTRPIREAISQWSKESFEKTLILFGGEHHGLSHEQLIHCDELVTIPASPQYTALNLAMSLGIVAYEIRQSDGASQDMAGERRVGWSDVIERQKHQDRVQAPLMRKVCETLFEAAESIGYHVAGEPFKLQMGLRRILGRAKLSRLEAQWILGFCQQIVSRTGERFKDPS